LSKLGNNSEANITDCPHIGEYLFSTAVFYEYFKTEKGLSMLRLNPFFIKFAVMIYKVVR